jgi:hypothetical protein
MVTQRKSSKAILSSLRESFVGTRGEEKTPFAFAFVQGRAITIKVKTRDSCADQFLRLRCVLRARFGDYMQSDSFPLMVRILRNDPCCCQTTRSLLLLLNSTQAATCQFHEIE